MLPFQYRLKKDRDFKLVFKKGKTLGNKFLFLNLRRNNSEFNKFGFVVGLKISKKAVIRNKIKRQLREIIKKNLIKIKSSFDIVIVARPKITEKNYQEMKEKLEELIKEAGLFKETFD